MSSSSYDSFNQENKAINIYHGDSSIDSYFQLIAPFEITYEFCSGTSCDDYLNVVTLSPDYVYSLPASYHTQALYFNQRPLHRHSYFEVVIVLKGTILQKIEDMEIQCPEGSCYVLNKNLRHSENFIGESSLILIGLSTEFIQDILFNDTNSFFSDEKNILTHPLLDFFNEPQKPSGQKAYLSFLTKESTHRLIKELHTLSDFLMHTLLFPRFGATHILKGLIGLLFHYLFSGEYYEATHNLVHSGSEFLLFSKISHLLEESDGRISRKELEEKLHYSSNYINRIVKKYTELCLFDYSMYFCMKKAAHYLSTTTLSISEIAQLLGFTNRTHFYKCFRKIHHMTPKEYRDSFADNR